MITGYFILVSLLITRCFSSAIVSAPIKYGGQELVLDFPATVDDARIMALKFCREKLDLVDNTIEKQNCVKSLSKYLEAEVQKFLQKKMKESTSNDKSQRQSSSNVPTKEDKQVKVSLNIAGNQYELSYVPIEEPVEQVARRFCTQYQPNLGLTMNELHRCIEPVTSRLLEMESSSTKTSKNNDFIHSHDKQQTKQSMSSSSSSLSGAKKNTNTRKPPNNNHSKKSKDGKITVSTFEYFFKCTN